KIIFEVICRKPEWYGIALGQACKSFLYSKAWEQSQVSGQNTTNKDGIDLISYANTIFHSIDANLWLIFVVAVALIWLSAFFQRRRAYIMRGVITYLLLILLVTLFSREGTHHRPP